MGANRSRCLIANGIVGIVLRATPPRPPLNRTFGTGGNWSYLALGGVLYRARRPRNRHSRSNRSAVQRLKKRCHVLPPPPPPPPSPLFFTLSSRLKIILSREERKKGTSYASFRGVEIDRKLRDRSYFPRCTRAVREAILTQNQSTTPGVKGGARRVGWYNFILA